MSSDTGEKMKQLRIARNFSQQEIADLMGVSRQYISRWESGERNINIDQLMQYAKIMQVTLDYFSDRSPERTLSQLTMQVEDAFKRADIPEADIDKAYQDIMRVYLKFKEQKASRGQTTEHPSLIVQEFKDIKEE